LFEVKLLQGLLDRGQDRAFQHPQIRLVARIDSEQISSVSTTRVSRTRSNVLVGGNSSTSSISSWVAVEKNPADGDPGMNRAMMIMTRFTISGYVRGIAE
jgi:hypothetical protein